jgi:uncharacterized protein (DUF2267 family)
MSLNFNHYAQEGNAFIKVYTKKLNLANDTDRAGRILSSILHALRDIISVEESLQLISQFPMFLKAVYVNGWTTRKKQDKIKTFDDFIELVRYHSGKTALYDFENEVVAENHIKSTFMVLRQYISLGELEDIRTVLPKELKFMIYQSIMF